MSTVLVQAMRHTVTPTPYSTTSALFCPNCISTFLELHQNPSPTNNSVDSDQLAVSGAGDSAAVGLDGFQLPAESSLPDVIPLDAAHIQFLMDGNDPSDWRRIMDEFFDGIDELIENLPDVYLSMNENPPAARAVVEALSSVTISEAMVGSGVSLCAICKESFCVGDVAKKLPYCKHVYHSDCVLQWMGIHNTCPICRFELPTDDVDYENRTKGALISSGEGTRGASSRDGNCGPGNGNAGGSPQNVDINCT